MLCPYCNNQETKVIDKRDNESITRRRRECLKCCKRFTTYEKIELGLYRSADKIVVVTESFKNSIVRRSKVSSSKIRVIYNGSNNELLFPREKNQEILRKLKLEDKLIIGYAGTLGISHSLEFIFSEILKITNSKIHFLFITFFDIR